MAPLRKEEEKAASDDDISQQKQMEEFFQWSPYEHREPETMGQKFKRKVKENPFVPIGELQEYSASCFNIFIYLVGQRFSAGL